MIFGGQSIGNELEYVNNDSKSFTFLVSLHTLVIEGIPWISAYEAVSPGDKPVILDERCCVLHDQESRNAEPL